MILCCFPALEICYSWLILCLQGQELAAIMGHWVDLCRHLAHCRFQRNLTKHQEKMSSQARLKREVDMGMSYISFIVIAFYCQGDKMHPLHLNHPSYLGADG